MTTGPLIPAARTMNVETLAARIAELWADLLDYKRQVSKLEDELEEVEAERDRLAREVERLQQTNAILRAERSGAVWICPECDIAGCKHYRAALNPEGETP